MISLGPECAWIHTLDMGTVGLGHKPLTLCGEPVATLPLHPTPGRKRKRCPDCVRIAQEQGLEW